MKRFFKKIVVVVLTICMLLPSLLSLGGFSVSAMDNKTLNIEDLSSCRKTYISNDNTGYDSRTEASLPFEPVSRISVQSSMPESIRVYYDTDKGMPVIALENATDLLIFLETRSLSVGDILYGEHKLGFDTYGATQEGSNTPYLAGTGGTYVTTGEVGSGALIVQTSKDGVNYTQRGLSKFSNGYYTTNYLELFGGRNEEIFRPQGSELKSSGLYISVSLYYEGYTTRCWTEKKYSAAEITAASLCSPFGIAGIIMAANNPDVQKSENVCTDYRETYTFFVIEDSVETVTFNNLTTADTTEITEVDKPSSEDEEEYKSQVEQYNNYLSTIVDRVSETMHDGDMTTTGFYINVTNVHSNQYLKIKVKKNGKEIKLPMCKTLEDGTNQKVYEFKENGRYDISITSYSKKKNLTLYVDTASNDEAYTRYFGNAVTYSDKVYGNEFLDYSPNNAYGNMRIFDANSLLPVFLNKLTLVLNEYADSSKPQLHGIVKNKSTNEVAYVDTNKIILTQYGEYEILLTTNSDYYDAIVLGKADVEMAGDVRVYRFRFKLVGRDTDLTVNEQLLSNGSFKDLSIASPSDYAPKFYGVKRYSSGKGNIIVAFANEEDALQYAISVVWSEIELHKDSSGNVYWSVPSVDNPYGAKVESFSGWKNAQIVNELSRKMVETHHFDLTKSSTYLTIEKSVEDLGTEGVEIENVLDNLQLASLEKSVVVWYNERQRSMARAKSQVVGDSTVIKLVSKANYASLTKDENGAYSKIKTEEREHFFIKDSLGIDSNSIWAMDSTGNRFCLNYDEDLYTQLRKQGCKSGKITITEYNVYGMVSAHYSIFYIEEGYQPAKLLITADGSSLEVSQDTAPHKKAFKRLILTDVVDYIDSHTYVRVTNKSMDTPTTYYSISSIRGMEFSQEGKYQIAIIDRFGNSLLYEFEIE